MRRSSVQRGMRDLKLLAGAVLVILALYCVRLVLEDVMTGGTPAPAREPAAPIASRASTLPPEVADASASESILDEIYVVTGEHLSVVDEPKAYTDTEEFANHLVTLLVPGDELRVIEVVGWIGTSARVRVLSHNGVAVRWTGYIPTDVMLRNCRARPHTSS